MGDNTQSAHGLSSQPFLRNNIIPARRRNNVAAVKLIKPSVTGTQTFHQSSSTGPHDAGSVTAEPLIDADEDNCLARKSKDVAREVPLAGTSVPCHRERWSAANRAAERVLKTLRRVIVRISYRCIRVIAARIRFVLRGQFQRNSDWIPLWQQTDKEKRKYGRWAM